MRLAHAGIQPRAPLRDLTFDGRPISGYADETIAACLVANGIGAFRTDRAGAPRGMYCGMGVCFECLVRVDGRENVRACMTALGGAGRIETQDVPGRGPAMTVAAPELASAPPVEEPELLIVGGGPAGLSAARAAALAGCDVTLLDERAHLGGQYFKQLASSHEFTMPAAMDRQFTAGRDLIDEVRRLGVTIHEEALVWGAFSEREICALVGGRAAVFRPQALVIAAGAYERAVAFPGWTLPGVMSTGAAQTLLRSHRVAAGARIVVGGNGPLNFQVAAELVDAGANVVAVVEAASGPGIRTAPAALGALFHTPRLMAAGASYLRRLRRAGVDLHYRHALVEAHGDDRVAAVTIAPVDATGTPVARLRREIETDAVCVGFGFLPANEASRMLGCRHGYDPARSSLVVEKDGDCQTTVPGVYVAGDSGGMGGALVAIEEGCIAACHAARALGRELPDGLAAEVRRRRRQLASHRRFQSALWRLFRAPQLHLQFATGATVICRCEGVTLGMVREAVSGGGCGSVGAVKRVTRAGMGRCQGRYCGLPIARLVAEATGEALDEMSFFAPRPPIKPVPIAAIAHDADDGYTPEHFAGVPIRPADDAG